jgi:hypothetical protein
MMEVEIKHYYVQFASAFPKASICLVKKVIKLL